MMAFRGHDNLDERGGECRRAEDGQDGLAHGWSPGLLVCAFGLRGGSSRELALCPGDNDGPARLLRRRPSRSGEQISWSKNFSAKYSAASAG
jgi:hypothetical protein